MSSQNTLAFSAQQRILLQSAGNEKYVVFEKIIFGGQKEYERVLQEIFSLILFNVTSVILYVFRPLHTYK
jgi:hypothetical protein